MLSNKQIFLLLILVILTLFLRDLPYLNVLFISRIWLMYFAILLFVLLAGIKFRVTIMWIGTYLLFGAAFVLTFMRLTVFAEFVGVFVYFLFWAIVVHRLIGFFKDKR